MEIQQGFAEVNGTRLYYEVAGTGAPLVLIHGFTLDTRMWDEQFVIFAERHRVVRYDARGFGQSAPFGTAPYAHPVDLAALLHYLGIPRAAILGLSMGGGIAVDFALAYPDMTTALIPADAMIGGHRWSATWVEQVGPVWQTARSVGIDAGKALWLALPLFAPAHEQSAVRTRLSAMVADYSGAHWLGGDPQRGSDPPAIERLSEIRAPTIVLIGKRDIPDFHTMADTIVQHVPGALKVVLPNVGHMANMEAPDAFNAEVLRFLTHH